MIEKKPKRKVRLTTEGRQAHRDLAERQKAERWGGAVETELIHPTLPKHLARAIKAEAKRSRRPIGVVLYGLIDPEKVAELP